MNKKKQKNFSRLARWMALVLGVILLAAVALDRIFPPNLSRLARQGSEILDKDGRIVALRPAPGGVWRFRTTVDDVSPVFLRTLSALRPDTKVVLVAADTLAALGAKAVLADMGLVPMVLTGPCTDTPTIQARTQALCGIPAINMARGGGLVL